MLMSNHLQAGKKVAVATDGHKAYLSAIESTFCCEVGYALRATRMEAGISDHAWTLEEIIGLI